MASGDSVQLIKDRLNIIDVVSAYVELKQAGRHFKGRCPFHNEKSPSFHVSPERGTYHCFGCGVGGDIFSFTQAIDGVDFKEALKTLAAKANVELVPEAPEKRTHRERLVTAIEAATGFYEAELAKCPEALAYLEKRGVSKETIAKWRIGYAPGPPSGGWREVRNFLTNLGYQDDIMLQAGLIKGGDEGKEPFDVFRDRIMFPLRDAGGKVVAFSGRILHPDDKAPKYVNSPETELFHKSDLLYGYDMAKHHLRQLPFWLIVEGQFDVVMSHQAGYTTTVAVSGTAFTLHHAQLLERLSKNVVLGLDADKAGINAMKKTADLLLRRGLDVKVASFPDGADPADMVVADLKGFKHAIGQSVHIIEFLLSHIRAEVADDRAYKLRVHTEVVPFVVLIPNRIDQEHFEGVIANALGTTKDAVHFEVMRLLEKATASPRVDEATVGTVDQIATPPAADLRHKTLAYLIASLRVIAVEEGDVIKNIVTKVADSDWQTITSSVDEVLVNQLTFRIETEFEKVSAKVRHSELVHKLNLFREATYRERVQQARTELSSVDGGGEVSVLSVLATATAALREPAYTEAIFKGGLV
jgi:DNA primase